MKTRSLWLPFGVHFAWNFSQTTLFGLPTSGMLDDAHALFNTARSGPAWIGGGEFGPEGGLLATIALLACLWYILKAGFLKPPEGIVTLDSIEDLVAGSGGGKG
jgi:membrane protease YdiL (CAAX protease family)